MPIYEYRCDKCGHEFEHLAKSMAASGDKVACPECSSAKTRRRLSVMNVKTEGATAGGGAGGHVHSGGCGCGRPQGSCGMN